MTESVPTVPVDFKGGNTENAADAAGTTNESQELSTHKQRITSIKEEEQEGDQGSCDIPELKKVAQHDLNETAVAPQSEPIEPNVSSSSLDRLFHNQKSQIKYYKIIYRGVVALVLKPELNSNKSGGTFFSFTMFFLMQ